MYIIKFSNTDLFSLQRTRVVLLSILVFLFINTEPDIEELRGNKEDISIELVNIALLTGRKLLNQSNNVK